MSNLNNRVQKLETYSSKPKAHYTWVQPGLTEEELDTHVKQVRRERGLTDDVKIIAFRWKS